MIEKGEFLKAKKTGDSVIDGGFLQSEHWEGFQGALGRKVIRIENEAASALLIEHQLSLVGSYFFVPRGPIFKIFNFQFSIFNQFINELITQAKDRNIGWVRIEPQSEEDLEMIKKALEGKYKLVKSKKDHEPAQTIMMDIEKSQEEILAAMKPKTRYNIRLAEKKGVKTFESRKKEDVEKFCDLLEATSTRDGVVGHPRDYYKKMLDSVDLSVIKLFLAKYENEKIAGALVSFHGGVATYLHGASANEHRNVMAPYLLQWEIIKKAKELGCGKYDLGGVKIIENENNKHLRWEGITRFKTGFCPHCQPVIFPGCWDIVLNNYKYKLYRFLQRFKGWLPQINLQARRRIISRIHKYL
jgi:peptidoglycan pentaglycine glycine transferase (the first glycine)